MSLPEPGDYRTQLADDYGPWCAWCLDYLCPAPPSLCSGSDVERHHMIQRNWTDLNLSVPRRGFGRHPIEWVVYVHGACHRGRATRGSVPTIQDQTDVVTRNLSELDPSATGSLEEDTPSKLEVRLDVLDQLARETHEAGLYQVSVILKGFRSSLRNHLDQRPVDEPIGEQELGSLAGVRHKTPLRFGKRDLDGRPRLAYHAANYYSDRGDVSAANAALEKADSDFAGLSPSQRDDQTVDKLLRHAQVRRSGKDAAEASSATAGYRGNTAAVMTAFIDLGRGDLDGTLEAADSLLTPRENVSWLYRSEGCFAQAAALLVRPSAPGAATRALHAKCYRLLSQAQYICVLLGLQAPPHPEVRERLHLRPRGLQRQWAITPGDVTLERAEFAHNRFSPEDLTRLRIEAIATSGLREQIIRSLDDLTRQPRSKGVYWRP